MTALSPIGAPVRAATMQSACIVAPGRCERVDASVPEPGASEVRIKLEGSGVCASSLPVWEGRDWFAYPREPGSPGHEGWGVIDAIGTQVSTVRVGQRVAALSYHAFAEYDLADANAVVPLPASFDGVPFPGEPLGCAMNVFKRSAIEPGHTVAIVGIGFLGALLTRLAANAGARVIAISRRVFALELARDFGAAETIAMDDHQTIIDRVKALTDGAFCDRVIEAVGLQWPLDLAGELTRERGRLVIAGFHQDGPRQVNLFLWNWRGLDVINAHERDAGVYIEGVRAAVEAVERGELDPRPLLSHRYGLHELDRAMAATRDRPDGFMKAVVMV